MLVLVNAVGLTPRLLPHAPRLNALAEAGWMRPLTEVLPAVTCTAQAAMLTGRPVREHGIVGNGWLFRDTGEVRFWQQSDKLVQRPRLWHIAKQRDPDFTCANLLWWFAMYCGADYTVTPRPMYPADGRKVFDIYTGPMSMRHEIKKDLGEFPFPTFWGPAAGVNSPQGPPDAASRWIAELARWVERKYAPTLNLIYLPHLDYNLQRFGPTHPGIAADVQRVDEIVGGPRYVNEREIASGRTLLELDVQRRGDDTSIPPATADRASARRRCVPRRPDSPPRAGRRCPRESSPG